MWYLFSNFFNLRIKLILIILDFKNKGYYISLLIIYGGCWIGLCVGKCAGKKKRKKKSYGQWNCLIWWFEIIFLSYLEWSKSQYAIAIYTQGSSIVLCALFFFFFFPFLGIQNSLSMV